MVLHILVQKLVLSNFWLPISFPNILGTTQPVHKFTVMSVCTRQRFHMLEAPCLLWLCSNQQWHLFTSIHICKYEHSNFIFMPTDLMSVFIFESMWLVWNYAENQSTLFCMEYILWMVFTQKQWKHSCLSGTYFLFSYTSGFPLTKTCYLMT